MNIDVTANRDGIHLQLAGELTIYTATEIHAALVDALTSSPTLTLDLDGVTDFDTAGLQLLLSASRTPQANVRITALSPSVARVFELAGIDQHLTVAPDEAPPAHV